MEKKKIGLFLFGIILVVGLVTAAYIANHTDVSVGGIEAFTNEYAVSDDNLGLDCSAVVDWTPLEDIIDLGDLYPLDTRTICIRVSNEATNDLDYATLVGNEMNLVANIVLTSGSTEVLAESSSIDSVVLTMNDDAPVGDYTLSLDVTRG